MVANPPVLVIEKLQTSLRFVFSSKPRSDTTSAKAGNEASQSFTIIKKTSTGAFSWVKAATTAFTRIY